MLDQVSDALDHFEQLAREAVIMYGPLIGDPAPLLRNIVIVDVAEDRFRAEPLPLHVQRQFEAPATIPIVDRVDERQGRGPGTRGPQHGMNAGKAGIRGPQRGRQTRY